jgi:NTP pyrophosphatase (non-canonical NTP hydrolase)
MDFLEQLRQKNGARLRDWEGGSPADAMFHSAELAGEVGEALNVAKKLHRTSMGWVGSSSTVEELAKELADVLICLDKLAAHYDIDLREATVAKFNATSVKHGFPQRLK